jgi:hypothetical protein
MEEISVRWNSTDTLAGCIIIFVDSIVVNIHFDGCKTGTEHSNEYLLTIKQNSHELSKA